MTLHQNKNFNFRLHKRKTVKSSIVTSKQLDWCIHGICHERKRSIHQSLADYFSYNKASEKKNHDMHLVIKETFFLSLMNVLTHVYTDHPSTRYNEVVCLFFNFQCFFSETIFHILKVPVTYLLYLCYLTLSRRQQFCLCYRSFFSILR